MNVTRLAPSPTGALHLGNARTFLINWLMARQNAWKIILRIEDIDGPRIKRRADEELIEDLKWLGIDWDEGPVYQSKRVDKYARAIDRLIKSGHAYPCVCSRKEVELAASAPHAEDGAAVYPGTCRGKFSSIDEARAATGREPALRFLTPSPGTPGEGRGEGSAANEESLATRKNPHPSPLTEYRERGQQVTFEDRFHGTVTIDVAKLGDFVIAKADGTPAYQLAVVVDDAEMGVTEIVRGDDLLDSTPRQILVYRALGLEKMIPRYTHLPLVIGTDGRRLAKRHGDTRLSHYRKLGVKPERVLALLARWSAIADTESIGAKEMIGKFDLSRLPHEPIVFTEGDDQWLHL